MSYCYIKGTIETMKYGSIEYSHVYVSRVRTPRLIYSGHSYRSRMEALTEALKGLGMPL